MPYVNLKTILDTKPYLLTIKAHTSFTQTFKKIRNTKTLDFVFVQKPQSTQMAAVVLWRIFGKRFFWIQRFENPPIPNFFTKMLLRQADRIVVDSKKDMVKLKGMEISETKIKYTRLARKRIN